MNIAIVDYDMGNLFSIQQACAWAGMTGVITDSLTKIQEADGVILPGVGAFGNAMEALRRRELVEGLKAVAASGKPLMGICLGMQLLMSVSDEFGPAEGLSLVEGDVIRLSSAQGDGPPKKLPHVGWGRIDPFQGRGWDETELKGLTPGSYMYFSHSFHVRPKKEEVWLAVSYYGSMPFCSALKSKNIFACQFHPERSGPLGLRIFKNFTETIRENRRGKDHVKN